jgi:hypothetical protein
MYHYNYGLLVKEKQQEIEKISQEKWKYKDLKQESLLKKIVKKLSLFKISKQQSKQNNCACICEC